MKWCWLILLGLYCALVQRNVYADAWQDIQQRGILRVAVSEGFPPFGSVDKTLAPQGYDIDLARYFAVKMGVNLQLIPVTSANRVAYLQTHKVDLVIASLGKNKAREAVIDFSVAYAPFYIGVYSGRPNTMINLASLSGKIIGVTRGAMEDLVLSAMAPSSAIIKRYEENNTTFAAWLSGQVDAFASGNVAMANFTRLHPQNSPLLSFALQNSPCYIGMGKGQRQLKERINSLIHQAEVDGTLNRLSLFWLKTPFNLTHLNEVAA